MPQIVLIPVKLDRNLAEEKLDPQTTARELQSVDVTYTPGRARRGPGFKRTQIPPIAGRVLGCAVWTRRDCTRIVVYQSSLGDLYSAPGDGSVGCTGPLDAWDGHLIPST